MATVINGVLDLTADAPILIKWVVVIGDTFRENLTRSQKGFDHTGGVVNIQLREDKKFDSPVIFSDTSGVFDVVVPTDPNEIGSCNFLFEIPDTETINFINGKKYYGRIRIVWANNTVETQ